QPRPLDANQVGDAMNTKTALSCATIALNELRAAEAYRAMHGYQLRHSHLGNCEANLKATIAALTPKPAPKPPPPSGVDLTPVRSVLVLAEDPMEALTAPPWYQFWVTADP